MLVTYINMIMIAIKQPHIYDPYVIYMWKSIYEYGNHQNKRAGRALTLFLGKFVSSDY